MIYVQVLAGFLLLLGGAEVLIRGAAAIARRFGVSPLVIGMTVVAFGTSAPELIVSVNAAFANAPGIAVGNIIGSNVANILLILGVTGLCRPIIGQPKPLVLDALILLGASALFAALLMPETLYRWGGASLLLCFVGFVVLMFWRETRGDAPAAETRAQEAEQLGSLPGPAFVAWIATIGGLAAVLFGADQLVTGGTALAKAAGVSDAVIGLTLVAVGTSLPELAASVMAGVRGHPDLAIGNIVGSNLFNILLVGGTVATMTAVPVDPQLVRFDIWVMLGATVLLMPVLLGRGFGRLPGLAFLAAYAGYITLQAIGVSSVLP